MNARRTLNVGATIAAVLAMSTHASAGDDTRLLWGEHVKRAQATFSERAQEEVVASRREPGEHLIWASQFPQAYQSAPKPVDDATQVATRGTASRGDVGEHLIWARHFPHVYQRAGELETIDSTQVAVNRR